MPITDTSSRPLAVTADDQLLDDLVRLAAAAGTVLDVAHDAGSVRRHWSGAPLVLVGDDLLAPLVAALPARRTDVVVIGRDLADSGLWQQAVAIGADHVVALPDAEPWLVERLVDAGEGQRRNALMIGVLGARGGAGASTLAAALAVTAARSGAPSLLVDADPLGGGIDLVVGGEDAGGLRWPDLAASEGRVSASALRAALPCRDGLYVLSWDRGAPVALPRQAMVTVTEAARRGGGVVVIDLPRYADHATEVALSRCHVVLLVVPTEVRAVAAAARLVPVVLPLTADLRVVTRGPSPGGLDTVAVAEALGLPTAGHLAPEPQLATALERGETPAARGKGPLAAFSARLLADLSQEPGRREVA